MITNTRNIVTGILEGIMGLVAFFLGFRIILKLFAANPQIPFVFWINQISDRLIFPFGGIVPNIPIIGVGVFDLVALIALTAYIVLIYLLIGVVDAATNASLRRHYHEHRHA